MKSSSLVRGWRQAKIGLGLALLALLATAPGASADSIFGTFGSGAGQTNSPRGIAVDSSNGHLYVADSGNNRIDVFDSSGTFIRAFGWGVDTGAAALQTCTTASTCQQGLAGGGAGQLSSPQRIAVDSSSHDVYVFDGNSRVSRFEEGGQFLRAWGWDVVASGPDNDTTPPTNQFEICVPASGDVCKAGVSVPEEKEVVPGVGQFDGDVQLATGPAGVYVADSHVVDFIGGSEITKNRLQEFEASGNLLPLPPACGNLDDDHNRLGSLAVDSSGDFYVSTNHPVFKFDSACARLAEIPYTAGVRLATDAADDLLAATGSGLVVPDGSSEAPIGTIDLYEASLAQISTLYGSLEGNIPNAVARHIPTAGIFASIGSGPESEIELVPFPAAGPVVHPSPLLNRAFPVGNVRATLNTAINPEGKATKYHFEYVNDATYQADGPGHRFDHAIRFPASAGEDPAVGSDFKLTPASLVIGCPNPLTELAEGKCLTPRTKYHFRAKANNADGEATGPEGTGPAGELFFTTKAPFEIKATWSTAVSADAATVHAEVDPLGIPTKGYFEYVDDATFKASGFSEAIKSGPIDFGTGEGAISRGVQLHPLAANTTYHYRVFVEDPFETEFSGEHTFTTSGPSPEPPNPDPCPNALVRGGPSARLPDCRAYELVSPLDKNNSDIRPHGHDMSAADGNTFTYGTLVNAFSEPSSAPFSPQVMASRDPEAGWQNRSISPPRKSINLYTVPQLLPLFKVFSEDLCSGWVLQDTDLTLLPGAPAGVPNVYRRDDCGEGEGEYELITPVHPPKLGVPSELENSAYYPEIQGSSADGGISVLRADAKLTADAFGEEEVFQLYVASGGSLGVPPKLRLVSVLPEGGGASTHHSSVGTAAVARGEIKQGSLYHAVSTDGSRIFWTETEDANPAGPGGGAGGQNLAPGKLYLRLNPTQPQSTLSGGKCTQPTRACTLAVSEAGYTSRFLTAAADGSRAIYADGNLAEGKADLYEFDVAKALAGEEGRHLIAHEVNGILGASEDASRVYLISREVLSAGENSEGDKAKAGKPNLYLYRRGAEPAFSFIATLDDQEAKALLHLNGSSPDNMQPGLRTSRVSTDGLQAVFTSTAPLTGYDNLDAQSGQPDAEVYLYDASGGGKGELLCVSCNRSGGRPVGRSLAKDNNGNPISWAAALTPGWVDQLHPGNLLSAGGRRIFFESFDSLLPRDVNGRKDVYEWERPGSVSCSEASPSFSPPNGGCISLITSGEGAADSELIDASLDGRDVFFLTESSLVGQDFGLSDIYDARVEGGFPEPAPGPPICEGEACQNPPSPPDDATPASSAFEGAGNLKGSKPRCAKGAPKAARHNKKAHCKKKHKRHHRRGSNQRGAGR
jgi:NHL repeat